MGAAALTYPPVVTIATEKPSPLGPSIFAVFGKLTSPSYQLVARIWNGEDVFSHSLKVNRTVLLSLIRKNIIACHATTGRLTLIDAFAAPPQANPVRLDEGAHP
jgi:hypothetical protein